VTPGILRSGPTPAQLAAAAGDPAALNELAAAEVRRLLPGATLEFWCSCTPAGRPRDAATDAPFVRVVVEPAMEADAIRVLESISARVGVTLPLCVAPRVPLHLPALGSEIVTSAAAPSVAAPAPVGPPRPLNSLSAPSATVLNSSPKSAFQSAKLGAIRPCKASAAPGGRSSIGAYARASDGALLVVTCGHDNSDPLLLVRAERKGRYNLSLRAEPMHPCLPAIHEREGLGIASFCGIGGEGERKLEVVGYADTLVTTPDGDYMYEINYIAKCHAGTPPVLGDSGAPVMLGGALHSFIRARTSGAYSLTPAHYALEQLRLLLRDPALAFYVPRRN
jgi:hypothetical protein